MKIEINLTKRTVAVFILGALSATAVSLWAEQAQFSATLPSPSGVFRRLITTGETALARDGGSVSIGSNTVNSATLRLPRFTRELTVAEGRLGDLAVRKAATDPKGILQFFNGAEWEDPRGGGAAALRKCAPAATVPVACGGGNGVQFVLGETGQTAQSCAFDLGPGTWVIDVQAYCLDGGVGSGLGRTPVKPGSTVTSPIAFSVDGTLSAPSASFSLTLPAGSHCLAMHCGGRSIHGGGNTYTKKPSLNATAFKVD